MAPTHTVILTSSTMSLRLIPSIHRATHQISLYLDRSEGIGVTQAEAHILAHLAANGESTVADLHRAFGHKRSTLTSIIDRLVARDLVTRDVSETDRRSFVVSLTRRGRALAAAVLERLVALERRALAGVPREAVTALLAALARVEEAATTTSGEA